MHGLSCSVACGIIPDQRNFFFPLIPERVFNLACNFRLIVLTCSTLKTVFLYHLTPTVTIEKSTSVFMYFLSLATFKTFFFVFDFSSVHVHYMGFFLFILIVIHHASCICRFRSAINSGKFSAITSINNLLLYSLVLDLYYTMQAMIISLSILCIF